MRCERCSEVIAEGEKRERYGQILCEDCYIDLLSQLKACDPWAVHSAKSFSKDESYALHLNTTQQKILDLLKAQGPMQLNRLSEILQIKEIDLEREIAVLRHMEKVRGELRGKERVIRMW